MPDISSVGHGSLDPLSRLGTVNTHSTNGLAREIAGTPRASDRVELSEHARFLDVLQKLPEGRLDQVEAVREAIAEGTYDTDDKLNLAIARLLDDLGD
jgi:negative regulator of flagellin synthesis FlgM